MDFDSHLDDANPELAEHNETVLKRTLAQLKPLTWERKVRDAIEEQLPEGEPSAEHIAKALHLSLRSLQRHLADEGCRFDTLLNESRENLALLHLRDPQCFAERDQLFAGVCRYQQFQPRIQALDRDDAGAVSGWVAVRFFTGHTGLFAGKPAPTGFSVDQPFRIHTSHCRSWLASEMRLFRQHRNHYRP